MESDNLSTITDYLQSQATAVRAEAIAADSDLLAIREEEDGTAVTTNFVALSYGDYPLYNNLSKTLNDSVLADAANKSRNFLLQAFSLADKEISEPILLNGRVVVVLQLLESRPATINDNPFSTDSGDDTLIMRYATGFFSNLISTKERDRLLKSPALKDNFSSAFQRFFPNA